MSLTDYKNNINYINIKKLLLVFNIVISEILYALFLHARLLPIINTIRYCLCRFNLIACMNINRVNFFRQHRTSFSTAIIVFESCIGYVYTPGVVDDCGERDRS